MGVKNCPETPRQKLIGLMYIVFMALTALNVAGEILEAFKIVNNGMLNSVKIAEERNKNIYDNFEKQKTLNEAKVIEYYKDAQIIKNSANELFNNIQDLKVLIVRKADGVKYDINNIRKMEDLNVGSEQMIGLGKGKKLKENINNYRELCKKTVNKWMTPITDKSILNIIEDQLNTNNIKSGNKDDKLMKNWENVMFENMPLIACISMMTKFQADVRNTEAEVSNFLFKQITAEDFSVNTIGCVVLPESNYVLKGEEFKADVFMAAYDNTKNPSIVLNGGRIIPVKDGKGIIKEIANTLGIIEKKGQISYRKMSGEMIVVPFQFKYMVGERGLVVSPTKMNVMYYGIENPLEVSAPGIPSENLKITIKNATYTMVSPGSYLVKPTSEGGNADVSVVANIGGKNVDMGTKSFRLKVVPDPVPKVAGRKEGKIPKNELLAQVGIVAELENFVFDLKFIVKSFVLSATVAGYSNDLISDSYKFTPEQFDFIKKLRKDTKIYFEDIKVVGPDGKDRNLQTVMLKIN